VPGTAGTPRAQLCEVDDNDCHATLWPASLAEASAAAPLHPRPRATGALVHLRAAQSQRRASRRGGCGLDALGLDPPVAPATRGGAHPRRLDLSMHLRRAGPGVRCPGHHLRAYRGPLPRWPRHTRQLPRRMWRLQLRPWRAPALDSPAPFALVRGGGRTCHARPACLLGKRVQSMSYVLLTLPDDALTGLPHGAAMAWVRLVLLAAAQRRAALPLRTALTVAGVNRKTIVAMEAAGLAQRTGSVHYRVLRLPLAFPPEASVTVDTPRFPQERLPSSSPIRRSHYPAVTVPVGTGQYIDFSDLHDGQTPRSAPDFPRAPTYAPAHARTPLRGVLPAHPGVRARGQVPPHEMISDDYGTCVRCPLPASHPVHTGA
jgi:hypothetical protein